MSRWKFPFSWFSGSSADSDPRRRAPFHQAGGQVYEDGSMKTLDALVGALLADRKSDRRARVFRVSMYALMVAVPAAIFFVNSPGMEGFAWSSKPVVAVVHLDGPIEDGTRASAARVLPALRRAFADKSVQAVVINIDSGGGVPIESERINDEVTQLKRQFPKPYVAVINNIGASAAYMVALHADQIYAGNYSIVGSIGAVMEGWDVHNGLSRFDVSRRVYASGELKSMLNPYIAMSPRAEGEALGLVKAMGDRFKQELYKQRGSKLKDGFDYATGGVWAGPQAKAIGIVDEIGTLDAMVAARWKLPVRDFGPGSSGVPIPATASSWLQDLVSKAFASSMREASSNNISIH